MRSRGRFRGRFGPALVAAAIAAVGLTSSAAAATGAHLVITPTTKNYGSVVAGTSSGPTFTFTVSNTGTVQTSGTLTASLSGSGSNQFTITSDGCSTTTLGANGDSCTIDVKFTPTALATGTQNATLNVTATPGGTVHASLSGTALNAKLVLSPTSYTFGNVPVGTPSGAGTFTLTNTGGGTAGTHTISFSGANAGDFAYTGGTCQVTLFLAAGNSCTIEVTFTPSVAANENAKLNVSASPGGSVAASLTGTGVTAKLSISPTSWNFGSVVAGTISSAQTFTVTNVGGLTSGTLAFTVTGDTSNFLFIGSGTNQCVDGLTLAPGASCTFDGTFQPTSSSSGKLTAKVTATASPGGTVATTVTGTALNAVLTISPPSYNFDSVAVNGGNATYTFTVANAGSATSGQIAFSKSGGAAGDYSIAPGSSGSPCVTNGTQTLAAGANCTIDITFDPSAGGNRNATVNATASPGGTASTSLSGTGAIAKLTISPGGYNFGSATAGTPVGPVTFTVANSGTAPTSVGVAFGVTGTNMAEFSAVSGASNGCLSGTTILAVGASCTIDVTWNSTAPTGDKKAQLNASAGPGEGTPHAGLSGKTT